MINPEKTNKYSSKIKYYAWFLIGVWSIIVLILLFWDNTERNQESLDHALIYSNVAYDKDLLFRQWNTMHRGVYVQVTNTSYPNPYLSDISERDITTPSGRQLTLINPEYMIRQVSELEKEMSDARSHLTSLKPTRSENEPDAWEKKALVALENGEKEVTSVEIIEGREYFRMMRPLITEKGCLDCHAREGYKENDIRGGLSVSMPMDSIRELASIGFGRDITDYFLLWLFGICGLASGYFQLSKSELKRNQVEKEIEKSLDEKETLLKEIHHRVKNNMQIISSLLNHQMEYIEDEKVAEIFIDSQNRISSMALVHEKLYQTLDLRDVNFKEYINNLTSNLFQSYNINSGNIRLDINVEDVSLDIDHAIPTGLIINELVTNSLKYAFPEGTKGWIRISFRATGEDMFELIVGDNGIGLPKDLDFRKTKSLGLHLVTILVENQLHGTIDINRNNTTEFQIRFKGIRP